MSSIHICHYLDLTKLRKMQVLLFILLIWTSADHVSCLDDDVSQASLLHDLADMVQDLKTENNQLRADFETMRRETDERMEKLIQKNCKYENFNSSSICKITS